MKTYPIIVGADGTDSSKAAVRWAAHEARRRGLPLRVTYVYEWQVREDGFEGNLGDPDFLRKRAEGVAGTAAYEARKVEPQLPVEADPVIGHPAARLLIEAADAELVVLGSRGRGGFAGLLLGSVSQRVATHAPGPVVVVRGRETDEGPVVVGVDDSPVADLVLQTAFDQASGRGCALTVVRSFLPDVSLRVRVDEVQTPDQDATELVRLQEQLAPWRDKYPETGVDVVVTHRSPAGALVEASRHAQLVVVGSRGHGVLAGSLLGSVGLQLLHHADCPVYIARPPAYERS